MTKAEDRLDIADALYRLGVGIDAADEALLASAFTADAVADFGPAARSMGVDFPVLTGQAAIASTLAATVGQLDTTHAVSNPRATADGDGRVILRALVEAAHVPPGDHARRCVMHNRYVAEMRRAGNAWRIARLGVTCAGFEGDPRVLLGR